MAMMVAGRSPAGGALAALALGADAVSLALGAAVVAVAFVVLVVSGTGRRTHRAAAPGTAGHGRRQGRASQRRQRGREAPRSGRAHAAEREARIQGRRTIDAIEAAEARLFCQLEALDWLRAELRLAHPLPPTRGFAAAPDALVELVRLIDRVAPAHGPGAGQRRLHASSSRGACSSSARGACVALEHLPEHAERTRAELVAQGLADVASVLDAPLEEGPLGDRDLELVPARRRRCQPSSTRSSWTDRPAAPGRWRATRPCRCCATAWRPVPSSSSTTATAPTSRRCVRRWQAEVDGLQATHLPLAKGAWLLTMPGG